MYLTGRGDRDGRNADFQLSWNHADPAERLNKKLSIDRPANPPRSFASTNLLGLTNGLYVRFIYLFFIIVYQ